MQIRMTIMYLNLKSRDEEYKENEKHVLLCIDNAEGLIDQDDYRVRALFSKLLSECDLISILLSLRKPIGPLDGSFKGYIQILDPLKPIAAAELFMEVIGKRELEIEEIYEFLTLDKTYPFHKLDSLKENIDNWETITTEAKNQLIRRLGHEKRVQI